MALANEHRDSPRRSRASAWTVRVAAARKDGVIVLSLIVIMLVLVTGCGGGESTPGTAPDLIGLEQSEAVAMAEDAGLQVEIEHRTSAIAPSGTVIEQSPPGGTPVEAGTTLTLVVSTGKE